MAYAGDRLIHDADSHLMELPDVLDPYLDPKYLDAFHRLPRVFKRDADHAEKARANHADPQFRAESEKIGLSLNDPRSGEELLRVIERAYDTPPQIVARLRKLNTL